MTCNHDGGILAFHPWGSLATEPGDGTVVNPPERRASAAAPDCGTVSSFTGDTGNALETVAPCVRRYSVTSGGSPGRGERGGSPAMRAAHSLASSLVSSRPSIA